MRIDTIEIRNFKGFADEIFHLNPRFTVFIGDNAQGKTSVLDALAVAVGSFFIGIEGVSSRTIADNEIRVVTIDGQPKPQKPVHIKATWNINERDLKIWTFGVKTSSLERKRGIETQKTTHKEARQIISFAENLLHNSRLASGTIFPVIAYQGTGRLWALHEKVSYQAQEEGVIMAYTNALSAKASPKEFLSWFKTQEDSIRKFEQPLDIAHLKAFKKVITDIIPDKKWQDVAFDNKTNELTGIFTSEGGKKEKLKFSQLSDGFRNIVALAADIAYRCIQLNPHLGEKVIEESPGVVLIDELDLHLHPNWQRRIVEDLKKTFPKIQFVATTHSPFIVQSLGADELINLDAISEVSPKELSIDVISQEIMGVESNYGIENTNEENETQGYLSLLLEAEKSANPTNYLKKLETIENNVSDPSLRAFLKMNRISKNIL